MVFVRASFPGYSKCLPHSTSNCVYTASINSSNVLVHLCQKGWIGENVKKVIIKHKEPPSHQPLISSISSSILTARQQVKEPASQYTPWLQLLKTKSPQRNSDGERNKRPVVLVRPQAVQITLADLRHHQVGVGVECSRLAAFAVAAGVIITTDAKSTTEGIKDIGERGHELGGDLDGASTALERVDGRGEVALDLVVDGLRDAREGWVQSVNELES